MPNVLGYKIPESYIIVLASAAVLPFIIIGGLRLIGQQTPEDHEWLQRSSALNAAENFIKKALKSPKTAQFKDGTCTKIEQGTYMVTGRVTSKNVFGVPLTTPYSIKLAYIGDSTWKCLEVSLTNP